MCVYPVSLRPTPAPPPPLPPHLCHIKGALQAPRQQARAQMPEELSKTISAKAKAYRVRVRVRVMARVRVRVKVRVRVRVRVGIACRQDIGCLKSMLNLLSSTLPIRKQMSLSGPSLVRVRVRVRGRVRGRVRLRDRFRLRLKIRPNLGVQLDVLARRHGCAPLEV